MSNFIPLPNIIDQLYDRKPEPITSSSSYSNSKYFSERERDNDHDKYKEKERERHHDYDKYREKDNDRERYNDHDNKYREKEYKDDNYVKHRETIVEDEDKYKDDKEEKDKKTIYNIHKLREFLKTKSMFITRIFIEEDTILFLGILIENIGEEILLYVPSKYTILPPSDSSLPIFELEVEENIDDIDNSSKNESYDEIHDNNLYDENTFAFDALTDDYKPINIQKPKQNRDLPRFKYQLEKFRNCVAHIRYKIGIINNNNIAVINRHNEIDIYSIIEDERSEKEIKKSNLILVIDLENFYKKLDTVSDDIINVYKTFYAVLHKAHTKQTNILEGRMKNYQMITVQLTILYAQKSKFLDLMDTLTSSITKAQRKEKQILNILDEVEKKRSENKTLSSEVDRSFKLTKTEKELQDCRIIKTKAIKTLKEIKQNYNQFLLDYDYSVGQSIKKLGEVTNLLNNMGISMDKKVKK
jgi:hypothetical protein